MTAGRALTEALLTWCDPTLVAEMSELADQGCDILGDISVYEAETEFGRNVFRYRELREKLERELIEKLRNGQLFSTGYDPRAPLDAPPLLLPADRWRVLTPTYENSSATGAGFTVFGILVYEDESAAGVPARPAPPRLRMSRNPRRARLDDTDLRLTPRSLRLLLVLAEAAAAGGGPVSRQDIETELWAAPVGKKAVADAVHKLKCELADQDVVEAAAYLLIENYLATGYRLAVAPSEIQIAD